MMMNAMNHSPAAKTAEIMSRYRPIAPKPETPLNPVFEASSVGSQGRSTAYLRSLWPTLQARPSRTRKRNRTGLSPISLKRTKPINLLSLAQWPRNKPAAVVTEAGSLVTLPLLPLSDTAIDLNVTVEENNHTVFSPQPIRPIGSSISVGSIKKDDPIPNREETKQVSKRAEEVEEEMESESLPAVVSDSNNRVRLTNSAYKEMVGQPECAWLDSMVANDGRAPCKRIGGEVMIRFSESDVPAATKGFSCWVNIEWGKNGGEKNSVNVFCDVIRLVCETKDYLFAWRFHTR